MTPGKRQGVRPDLSMSETREPSSANRRGLGGDKQRGQEPSRSCLQPCLVDTASGHPGTRWHTLDTDKGSIKAFHQNTRVYGSSPQGLLREGPGKWEGQNPEHHCPIETEFKQLEIF